MDVDDLLDCLEAEGEALLAAAVDAGWDAPVPRLTWDVRTLVIHTGGVHRWARAIVRGLPPEEVTGAQQAVGSGPDDDDLVAWFAAGVDALAAALRRAPADLDVFTFLPAESPRHFWARRQAHETAMHRADAEAAGGQTASFDVEFAQDGIAELLLGFAARRRHAIARNAAMRLEPIDRGAPWRVVFGGDTTRASREPDAGDADLVVSGTSSDLYLWLWNRDAEVELRGDESLADLWRDTVQVRW